MLFSLTIFFISHMEDEWHKIVKNGMVKTYQRDHMFPNDMKSLVVLLLLQQHGIPSV